MSAVYGINWAYDFREKSMAETLTLEVFSDYV